MSSRQLVYFIIVLLAQHASSYYSPRGVCPTPGHDTQYPLLNNTKLMFIGAHHTGTTTYIVQSKKMISYFKDEDRMIHHPIQNMFWASNSDKLWEGDAYADCPVYAFWNSSLEFGNLLHPDVRTLFNCFPKSLFVINSRPLQSYLRTKVNWELRSPTRLMGKPSPMCGDANMASNSNSLHEPIISLMSSKFVKKVCEVALSREKLHKAYIEFILENTLERVDRFMVTDLELEGSTHAMYRVCLFSISHSTSYDSMKRQRLEEGCLEFRKDLDKFETRSHTTNYAQGQCELNSIRYVLLQHGNHNFSDIHNMPSHSICDQLPLFDSDLIATSSIFTFPEYVHNQEYKKIVTKLSSRFS